MVPRFLIRDPFDNIGFVSGYEGPLLIFHGTGDRVIPFSHAEQLRDAAASDAVTFVEWSSGHNDGPTDEAGYWGPIRRFLEGAELLVPPIDAGNE
jgi:fermentation-respiration switch protein FrsA (DUF1100 family)